MEAWLVETSRRLRSLWTPNKRKSCRICLNSSTRTEWALLEEGALLIKFDTWNHFSSVLRLSEACSEFGDVEMFSCQVGSDDYFLMVSTWVSDLMEVFGKMRILQFFFAAYGTCKSLLGHLQHLIRMESSLNGRQSILSPRQHHKVLTIHRFLSLLKLWSLIPFFYPNFEHLHWFQDLRAWSHRFNRT